MNDVFDATRVSDRDIGDASDRTFMMSRMWNDQTGQRKDPFGVEG